jgi:Co/Zn/Cd efflux system component
LLLLLLLWLFLFFSFVYSGSASEPHSHSRSPSPLVTGLSHGHSHSHGGGHGHAHGGGDKKKEKHGHSHGHGDKKKKEKHGHSHGHGDKKKEKHGHSHGHGDKKKKDKHGHAHAEVRACLRSDRCGARTHPPSILNVQKKRELKFDLNMWGVFIHYAGDMLSSAVVLVMGFIIHYVDGRWVLYIDPASSLLIVALILWTTYPLVRDCSMILLQSTPGYSPRSATTVPQAFVWCASAD